MAASVRTQIGELVERTLGGLPTLGGETVHLGEEWFARVYRLDEESRTIFLAHRLLVRKGFEQGPGFSIRFTVEYNLFGGTILELGNERQKLNLQKYASEVSWDVSR